MNAQEAEQKVREAHAFKLEIDEKKRSAEVRADALRRAVGEDAIKAGAGGMNDVIERAGESVRKAEFQAEAFGQARILALSEHKKALENHRNAEAEVPRNRGAELRAKAARIEPAVRKAEAEAARLKDIEEPSVSLSTWRERRLNFRLMDGSGLSKIPLPERLVFEAEDLEQQAVAREQRPFLAAGQFSGTITEIVERITSDPFELAPFASDILRWAELELAANRKELERRHFKGEPRFLLKWQEDRYTEGSRLLLPE